MSPALRDRLTGGIVVGAIVAIIVYYCVSSYWAELSRLQSAFVTQQKAVTEEQKVVDDFRRYVDRLKIYRQKSLPPQPDEARARYHEWLLEQVKGVQLEDTTITQGSPREQPGIYRQFVFKLEGKGTLPQVVDLFHRFYSVDVLHRIKSVSLKPIKDSRLLAVSLTIEARSLTNAESVKPGNKPKVQLEGGDLAAYQEVILNRNLFGPANRTPKFDSVSSQRGTRNQTISFNAKAKDIDELDKLTYSLGPQAPPGAKIDPQTGAFRWTAGPKGTYQVTIQVTDDGLPRKTDTAVVSINVGDPPPPEPPRRVVESRPAPPPPPKPNLELGKLAFVTAITNELDGRLLLWIHVRSTGETLQLAAGEKWLINGLSGVVKSIGTDEAVMELIDKKRYSVRIGESLSQAVEVNTSRTAAPVENP